MTPSQRQVGAHKAAPDRSRYERWAPLAVLGCALVVRLAYVVNIHVGFRFPDERCYWRVAENFRAGRGLILDEGLKAARAPLYPLLLAASQAVAGDNVLPVRLGQAVLGAVTCLLLFYLARAACGYGAGACAGAMAAVYPFFVFYTGLVLSETVFTALLVAAMLLLWRVQASAGLWSAAGAGVVFGAAVLTRPSALLLLPPALVLCWLGGRGKLRRLACVALALAGCGVVMAPWVWRNYRVVGKFVPTTLQVGASLYESNSPDADGGPAMDRIRWPQEAEKLSEYERDRYLLRESIAFIKADWRRFGRLCWHRCKRFWNCVPNYAKYRGWTYSAVSFASFTPVALLGVIGLALRLRRFWSTLLLALPVAYFAALHTVFVGSTRYRTPIMPFVMLFAGYALAVNYEIRHRRRTGLRLATALAWVAAAGVVAAASAWAWLVGVEGGGVYNLLNRSLAQYFDGPATIQQVRFDPWSGMRAQGIRLEVEVPGSDKAIIRAPRATILYRLLPLVNRELAVDFVEVEDISIIVRLIPNSKVYVPDVIAKLAELIGGAGRPTIGARGSLRLVEGRRVVADLQHWRTTVFPKRGSAKLYQVHSSWCDPVWGPCRLNGELDVSGPHFRGQIVRKGVRLTPEFRDKLPPELVRIWRDAGISAGSLDVVLGVSFVKGKDPDIRVATRLDAKGVAFAYKGFPYPVTAAGGRIELSANSVKLSGCAGLAGRAKVRLRDAQLQLPPPAGAMLTLEAEGVALDETLRSCLKPAYQKVWECFDPKGVGDATVDLEWRDGDPTPFVTRTVGRLRGCSMAYDNFPLPLTDITGQIEFLDDHTQLRGLKGRFESGTLSLDNGCVYYGSDGKLDLKIGFKNAPLNEQLRKVLDSDLQDLWAQLQPKGRVSGVYHLTNKPGKGAELVHSLRLTPDANEACYKPFPVPLREITGVVTCTSSFKGAMQFNAKAQGASISLSGPFAAGTHRLDLRAARIQLDETLFSALPPALGNWARTVRASGLVSLATEVRQDQPNGPTAVEGALRLLDCASDLEVGLDHCNGTITFKGQLGDRRHRWLAGKAEMAQLRIAKREIKNLSFDYEETGGRVAINSIEGDLLGGTLRGQLLVREPTPTAPARYEGKLSIERVRLKRLLTKKDKTKYRKLDGFVTVTVTFVGSTDEQQKFKASGSLDVSNGKLGELPLLLGVFSLVKRVPLDAAAFNSARLVYSVVGKRAEFKHVELRGPVVSLFGKGKVDKRGRLNFIFRFELGKEGNGIPSRIIDKTKDMLVPVELKGSYDDPIWRINPLLSVTRAIKGLIGSSDEVRKK